MTHNFSNSSGSNGSNARPTPGSRSFPLAALSRVGFRLRLHLATYLIAVGTTASLVVHGAIKRLQTERSGRGLPRSVNYMMVDSAAPSTGMDTEHFFGLRGAVAGAGTKATNGFALFHSTSNFSELRQLVNRQLMPMFQNDPELPWSNSPHEAMNFFLVGASGGTSGGGLHPAIGLLHDVARERGVREPRVHVLVIGADMPIKDRTRDMTIEQECFVQDTAANNLAKLQADFTTPGSSQEPRPDGTAFPIKTSHRVWSITVADHSNGQAQFSTTDGLVQMLAQSLFLRCFTQVGIEVANRFQDPNVIGVTKRAQ